MRRAIATHLNTASSNRRMLQRFDGTRTNRSSERGPGSPRALKALIAVAEVIRLARQASTGSSGGTTQRQSEPADTIPREAKNFPDFSTWTDEALEAAIEPYQEREARGSPARMRA